MRAYDVAAGIRPRVGFIATRELMVYAERNSHFLFCFFRTATNIFCEVIMSVVSLGLVDDHPLIIEGLVALVARAPGLRIMSTGSTANDIISISLRFRPDVILADLSMSGDVYGAISASVRAAPETKIIAFTAATGVDSAVRALDAGASGYVLKGSSSKELIRAIELVRDGETYITQSFANKVIAGLRNASVRRAAANAIKLSIREEQIVRLLLRSYTNKQIALSLRISEKTVKNYMTALMQKLQARNRLGVVLAAQELTGCEPEGYPGSQRLLS